MEFVDRVLDYLREGFHDVNAIQGLIIALLAAFFMSHWGRIWFIALGATVVHIVADMMLPVIVNRAEFMLPPLVEAAFWNKFAALYLGYLVAIAFFFFIKKNVLKGGH